MLTQLSKPLVIFVEKYLPDPFVFVLVLTCITIASAIFIEHRLLIDVIKYWGDGFWELLSFSMQMLLILVNGYLLANTTAVQAGLSRLSFRIHTPSQAIILVSLVSLFSSWINWGFGLVISAFFAKSIAGHVKVDYRLLVASAYSGFLVWHGGLSGSIPLVIASEGHIFAEAIGVIPTSETIFSTFNLTLVAALFVIIPLVNRLMLPKASESVYVIQKMAAEAVDPKQVEMVPSHLKGRNLEKSKILSYFIVILGSVYLFMYVKGVGDLNLNIINFTLFMLSILLYKSPYHLIKAMKPAVSSGSGVVLQFPFYAGIMSVMTKSGLAADFSSWMINFATHDSFITWSFLSAGLVNFFIPSGGGQWIVQAPILIPAAEALDVDIARMAMSVSWGDAWTNMVQPFWALPILAIAGLNAKDIMGFCLMQLIITGMVMILCLNLI
jgi:short-chain fatty acids transporter